MDCRFKLETNRFPFIDVADWKEKGGFPIVIIQNGCNFSEKIYSISHNSIQRKREPPPNRWLIVERCENSTSYNGSIFGSAHRQLVEQDQGCPSKIKLQQERNLSALNSIPDAFFFLVRPLPFPSASAYFPNFSYIIIELISLETHGCKTGARVVSCAKLSACCCCWFKILPAASPCGLKQQQTVIIFPNLGDVLPSTSRRAGEKLYSNNLI